VLVGVLTNELISSWKWSVLNKKTFATSDKHVYLYDQFSLIGCVHEVDLGIIRERGVTIHQQCDGVRQDWGLCKHLSGIHSSKFYM